MMPLVFDHGKTLDRYFELTVGVIWMTAMVSIDGARLSLSQVLIYPTTGTTLQVGVAEMLEIVTFLENEARLQGFEEYTVQAERVYTDKPARMIYLSRRLR